MNIETEEYNVWAYNHAFKINYPILPSLDGTRVISYGAFFDSEGATTLDKDGDVITSGIMEVPPGMDWSPNMHMASTIIPKGKHLCIMPKDGYEITNVEFHEESTEGAHEVLDKIFTIEYKQI